MDETTKLIKLIALVVAIAFALVELGCLYQALKEREWTAAFFLAVLLAAFAVFAGWLSRGAL